MEDNSINIELQEAVGYEKNLAKVKSLLSAGADVNFRVAPDKGTLLHVTNSAEITKELLLRGADVHAKNMYRETALHSAVTLGKSPELVRELLKHGAAVNSVTRKGNTALNHAVKKSVVNLAVIKELLEHGADINIRNWERRLTENCASSLDNAVKYPACAKLLIKFTLLKNFDKDYRKMINLAPYESSQYYSQLSSYLDDCVLEVCKMKTDEIRDKCSFYEFLTNNFETHVLFNNQLSGKLLRSDYSERYPIYKDIISDKIKPFLERVDLFDKLTKIHVYTELDVCRGIKETKIFLNLESACKIAEYLSNENLLNFIRAFEVPKKRTIQQLIPVNDISKKTCP